MARNLSKIGPKLVQNRAGRLILGQNMPRCPPRWSPNAPRCAQDGPTCVPVGPTRPNLSPKLDVQGPGRPPRLGLGRNRGCFWRGVLAARPLQSTAYSEKKLGLAPVPWQGVQRRLKDLQSRCDALRNCIACRILFNTPALALRARGRL